LAVARRWLWPLCALAVAALIAWLAEPGPAPKLPEPAAGPAASPATRPLPEAAAAPRGEVLAPTVKSASPTAVDGPPGPVPGARLGSGSGRIRGVLEWAPGMTPTPWTLRLAASATWAGAETGLDFELPVPAEQREFELSGLPLAGFELWAEAPAASSLPQPLLLTRGAEQVYVVLAIAPAGDLTGAVLDPDGLGIEGLLLTLVPEGAGQRSETRSNPAGRFAFAAVADGEYRLLAGPSEAPLLEKRLSFRAPGLSLDPLRLPRLLALEIQVSDAVGRPVEGARVRGFSTGGGLIDVSSDSLGRARAHLLAPGRISLRASVPGVGVGYREFELEAGSAEPPLATLVLSK
jgi:hypothetical protein